MNKTGVSREIKVLEFIEQFIGKHGYSPSMREIADGSGLASVSGVVGHLRNLRHLGLVAYVDGMNRTVRLTEKAR